MAAGRGRGPKFCLFLLRPELIHRLVNHSTRKVKVSRKGPFPHSETVSIGLHHWRGSRAQLGLGSEKNVVCAQGVSGSIGRRACEKLRAPMSRSRGLLVGVNHRGLR